MKLKRQKLPRPESLRSWKIEKRVKLVIGVSGKRLKENTFDFHGYLSCLTASRRRLRRENKVASGLPLNAIPFNQGRCAEYVPLAERDIRRIPSGRRDLPTLAGQRRRYSSWVLNKKDSTTRVPVRNLNDFATLRRTFEYPQFCPASVVKF